MKEVVRELHEFLKQADFDWCVCGGYAIDLFVGHNTRPHQSIDVAVFWQDKKKIIDFMLGAGWRVFEACGGGSIREVLESTDFTTDKRNLFCMIKDNNHYRLTSIGSDMYQFAMDHKEQSRLDCIEFLFSQKQDDDFLYANNYAICRSMQDAVLTQEGIPFLAPEIVLLYKSGYIEYLDKEYEYALHLVSVAVNDFNLLLPLLNNERKGWLKKALRTIYPNGHAWIRRIEKSQ